MTLPLGYEESKIDNSSNCTITGDTINSSKKKLVLIATPSDFDVSALKGQRFILNASTHLQEDINESKSTKDSLWQWEIRASSAKSDKHLNILLPATTVGGYEIAPMIEENIHLVHNIKIPHVEYPKISKYSKKLPKPDNLHPRWKPFGSGEPFKAKSHSPKKPLKITHLKVQDKHIMEVKNATTKANEDMAKKKKKKKKKKQKINNIKTEDEISVGKNRELKNVIKQKNLNNTIEQVKSEDQTSVKKKKKKKKKSLNDNNQVNPKHHFENESNSDINSDTENRIFGINKNNNNNDINVSTTAAKKERKRKMSISDKEEHINVKKIKQEEISEEDDDKALEKKKNKKNKKNKIKTEIML